MSNSSAYPIVVENVTKSFDKGRIPVIQGISLNVERGKMLALCGPSGCGKSTLLHLIAGFDEPDSGSIKIEGDIIDSETKRVALLRHKLGMVFQLHNLIPNLTLQENCLVPSIATGTEKTAALTRMNDLAEKLGIAHRLNNRIQDLSGGERQRTAICRALMNKPSVILADEPTGALDQKTGWQIFDLLHDLVSNEGVTLVIATHDLEIASRCDHMIHIKDGVIA